MTIAYSRLLDSPKRRGFAAQGLLLVGLCGLSLLTLSIPAPAHGSTLTIGENEGQVVEMRSTPRLLCFSTWAPSASSLLRRPRACQTHWRGRPFDGASFQRFRGLRWSSWHPNHALAKGRLFQNMVGWKPVRIRLSRSVQSCGALVFSRLSGKVFYPGGVGWKRLSFQLTVCE